MRTVSESVVNKVFVSSEEFFCRIIHYYDPVILEGGFETTLFRKDQLGVVHPVAKRVNQK